MLTFKKSDEVKFIDPDSSLIPVLMGQGWVVEVKPSKKKAESE